MTRPAALPRLSGPGELAAALPLLCGFAPQESLVLVGLRAGSSRVDLTVRVDLPAPPHEATVAGEVGERLQRAGVRQAYAFVVTEAQGPRPQDRLVEELAALPGPELLDLVLVRGGRWRSYLCAAPSCCPSEGLPVPDVSPALTLVRAQSALDGRAVLPSREALVAGLAPPRAAVALVERLRDAELRLAVEAVDTGRPRLRRRLVRGFRRALRDLEQADDAELALGLADVLVRDEVLTWSVVDAEPLLTVLLHLARCTPAPYDAGLCAALAWVAYVRGDGATATVALDRALATDPDHGLARLLRSALDQQVPPRELRRVALRTARALRG